MATGIKTGGRNKGTPNKVTKELREKIKSIVDNEITIIKESLKDLEPRDRMDFIIKLLPYVLPKATEEEGKDLQPIIKVEWLQPILNIDPLSEITSK